MKKIGSKVLLMMVLFVVIFGLNTITSVRSQNRVKRSGLEITEQYIPIQTEIFTIQKVWNEVRNTLILLVCMIMQNFVNSLKVHWQRKCQLLLRARRR